MDGILAQGEQLSLVPAGLRCEVVRKLNEGGLGEVYEVRLVDGTSHALKWYRPRDDGAERRAALRWLVDEGSPSSSFVWPWALADADGDRGFGYVMPLIGDDYAGLVSLLKGHVDVSLRSMAAAGHRLASSFLLLHSRGLCYRDINFGNVAIKPGTGDVLICDNDHVGVDLGAYAGVAGTPRFMAPEIARGEALPSTSTDLYSLAVLLFYLLHSHHPLHGARELEFSTDVWDGAAEAALFVNDPIFIFDPDDDRNRPIPGEHDGAVQSWKLLPKFVRKLFLQAFTVGLCEPSRRVGEMQWRQAMLRLRDSVLVCDGCTAQWFLDPDDRTTSARRPCWNCGRTMPEPLRLRLSPRLSPPLEVVLNDVAELNPHHLDPDRPHDVDSVLAVTSRRPADGLLGIRNLSDRSWVVSAPGGSGRLLEPGSTIAVLEGVRFQFGAVEGEVVQ